MVERVNTGGTVSFGYPKGFTPKASVSQKKDIEKGYAEAEERKAKERKKKKIIWTLIVIVVVILFIIGFVIF